MGLFRRLRSLAPAGLAFAPLIAACGTSTAGEAPSDASTPSPGSDAQGSDAQGSDAQASDAQASDSATPPGSDSGLTGDSGGLVADASLGAEAGEDASIADAGTDVGADASGEAGAAWTGIPAATPLIVRGPYLSTWSAANAPNTVWPTFWTGAIKAVVGIARVDGASFNFMGVPGGVTPAPTKMNLLSRNMTPTKTEFVFSGGGIALTVDFLSPVEPNNLQRQSAPLGYITATAVATDGGSHAVSVYFDISAEWTNADDSQTVNWTKESVPHAGGNLVVQSFTLVSPQPLTESSDYPSWGTPFLAADSTAVTTAIGEDTVVRSMETANGALDNSVDTNMPRAINNMWPVLGFSFDLGHVTASASSPATLVIGHARSPDVSYQGAPVPPLWMSYWSTWEDMVADAYDDTAGAASRNAALDERIVSDAIAAGGPNYAALCTMALRQAFGGTELVGTPSAPWLMLKEISSDGNVSTVDVVYPASPVFLYTNPLLLKLLLDPLLTYAESEDDAGTPLWPQVFAEHDLGASYPNASGHNDGSGENMPIEETANMLIMMAAYVQRAAPVDAQTYATLHYAIAKQWANYLVPNTLDPECQNQTDDFTGPICHSVNLSLKGIVGVGAMSILAQAAGNTADQTTYLNDAQSLIGQWAAKAQDSSGQHLLLEYDIEGQWSLKYNALYDRILGLNLVPTSILQEEATWYQSQAGPFGVILDPRNSYTKTDWSLWAAGAIDDATTRQSLIDGVYAFATNTTTARVPFSDWYCVVNGSNASDNSTCVAGNQKGFQARPVQGGIFSLLARQGTSIFSP